jgi:D-serine deaminase-like pyridoxal phosphate-dependent protein
VFYWPSWLDEAGFRAACAKIDAVLAALSAAGFEAKIVSGGSTPGASKTPLIPQTTEIRPGTYVFYDASSLAAKVCVEADLRAARTHDGRQHVGAWPVRDRRRLEDILE